MSFENIDFVPVDDCVVVEIDKIEKEVNGIALPEGYAERKQMGISDGILIKLGSLAFYDLIENDKEHPQPGNKVYFKRYSGILHTDKKTEREFKVIRDQDIYGFEEN
jgi:co-chaperonin GroES (HSP10)